ncbi:MAG: (d)CMP kinase [Spirochaetota bacterium]
MIVAIDGPAGSGKSSVARSVADQLGFLYLNSGRLYRAVSLCILENGVDPEDTEAIVKALPGFNIRVTAAGVCIGDRLVDQELHTDTVDRWVAKHSAIPEVRAMVNDMLHRFARDNDSVVEGRDMTTVVFPDAEVKVYLDASLEARAERRYNQGTSEMSLENIRRSIRRRDALDEQKPGGKLQRSEDAIYIDTSHLTRETVCDTVLKNIHRHTKSSGTVEQT